MLIHSFFLFWLGGDTLFTSSRCTCSLSFTLARYDFFCILTQGRSRLARAPRIQGMLKKQQVLQAFRVNSCLICGFRSWSPASSDAAAILNCERAFKSIRRFASRHAFDLSLFPLSLYYFYHGSASALGSSMDSEVEVGRGRIPLKSAPRQKATEAGRGRHRTVRPPRPHARSPRPAARPPEAAKATQKAAGGHHARPPMPARPPEVAKVTKAAS